MPAPAPFPRVKRQLLVSDFDESMADADSDRWTFEVLSPRLRRQFDDLSHAPLAERMQFTDLCAHLLEKLHIEEGKGEQDVRAAQRQLYMHPAMVRGFRAMRDAKADTETQTTCFLLSNSNEVYLGTILEVSWSTLPSFFSFPSCTLCPRLSCRLSSDRARCAPPSDDRSLTQIVTRALHKNSTTACRHRRTACLTKS